MYFNLSLTYCLTFEFSFMNDSDIKRLQRGIDKSADDLF
jgi:hypothetical protein